MVRPIAFGTVTRDALPDQIAARLIDLITERQLKAGDRLPPERELAASMGVSRSSLREALRALAMLGVAEMRHGDGTYLTSLGRHLADAPGRARARAVRQRPGGALRGAQARRARPRGARGGAHLRRRRRGAVSAAREAQRRRARGRRSVHVRRHRAARDGSPARRPTPCSSGCWTRSPAWASPAADARAAWHRCASSPRTTIDEIAAAIAAHDADAARAAMLRHLENVERAVTG